MAWAEDGGGFLKMAGDLSRQLRRWRELRGRGISEDDGGFGAPPIWTEFSALSVYKIYSYAYRKYQKSEKPLVNY